MLVNSSLTKQAVWQTLLTSSGVRVTKIKYTLPLKETGAGAFLPTIAICCPNLQIFYLFASEEVSDQDMALQNVLLNCTKLQELHIRISKSSNMKIDHTSLLNVLCTSLLSLTLEDIQCGELVASLLNSAPNIQSLSLLHCNLQLENCGSALESISSNTYNLKLQGVKDEMLIKMIDGCPNVKKIDLYDEFKRAKSISQRSVLHLATHTTGLSMVDLSYVAFFDAGLLALAEHHADTLNFLGILHCSRLSATAINATLRQCTQLTHFRCHFNRFTALLDFSLLANATDLHFAINNDCSLFASMALHCKKLVHLRVDNTWDCDLRDGLKDILLHCPQISTIDLFYSNADKFMGEERLQELKCLHPNLVVCEDLLTPSV